MPGAAMQIVECYLPLVRFIACACNDSSWQYTVFRSEVKRHIDDAYETSKAVASREEDTLAARFAMVVWVDEMVLRSSLDLRHAWRETLLQAEYHQTLLGGEAFFDAMDAAESSSLLVRNVYLACLLLGFRGKYHDLDDQALQTRIHQARRTLPPAWREDHRLAEITPCHLDNQAEPGVHRFIRPCMLTFALLGLWSAVTLALWLSARL